MADTPDNNEPEDLIRYDILAQEALRGVVKKVLGEVASTGALPGDHHFYITFDTSASGVKISPRMREKYPEEMTIVVQHQFWDLKTTETGFQIGLSFNDIGEMLVIPFSAIRGFFDPSVQFGLQFDAGEIEETQEAEIQAAEEAGGGSRGGAAEKVNTAAQKAETQTGGGRGGRGGRGGGSTTPTQA